jgi:sulfur carrier protein ThiS
MPAMETVRPTAALILRGKRHEIAAGSTLRDSIRRIGLSPEAVLAVRDGVLLTDDCIVRKGEEIQLVPVMSGG